MAAIDIALNFSITRLDTRHKLRLVCVFFTFENNTGQTDIRTDGQMDGQNLLQRCDSAFKNATTVEPRYRAFQGATHIYVLKRGYAIAGIGFTVS